MGTPTVDDDQTTGENDAPRESRRDADTHQRVAPFGGARASGTNDKAGSKLNLVRWVSARTVKETFVPPRDHKYPFMNEELAAACMLTCDQRRGRASARPLRVFGRTSWRKPVENDRTRRNRCGGEVY